MRNASAAMVPLFLAIVLLFWFMMIMGGSSDTLKAVSSVENLRHLQTKLLIPAVKHKLDQKKAGIPQADLNAKANIYINKMMVLNKIQK